MRASGLGHDAPADDPTPQSSTSSRRPPRACCERDRRARRRHRAGARRRCRVGRRPRLRRPRRAQTPVTADTHFRVGSISKTFVAMASGPAGSRTGTSISRPPSKKIVADDRHRQSVDDATIPSAISTSCSTPRASTTCTSKMSTSPSGLPSRHSPTALCAESAGRAACAGGRERGWRTRTRATAWPGAPSRRPPASRTRTTSSARSSTARDEPTSSFRLTTATKPRSRAGTPEPPARRSASRGSTCGPPATCTAPHASWRSSSACSSNWGELGTTLRRRSGVPRQHGAAADHAGDVAPACETATAPASPRGSTLPYRVLGHDGGIDGFVSTYGYSPSRDVGSVVLLNSSGPRAGEALRTAVVAGNPLPEARGRAAGQARRACGRRGTRQLRRLLPRREPAQSTRMAHRLAGRRAHRSRARATRCTRRPVQGRPRTADSGVRHDRSGWTTSSTPAMCSRTTPTARWSWPAAQLYAERRPRWRVEFVRAPTLASIPVVASVLLVALGWVAHGRRARPRGFWGLKSRVAAVPAASPAAGRSACPDADARLGHPQHRDGRRFSRDPAVSPAAALVTALALRSPAARRQPLARRLCPRRRRRYGLRSTVYLAAHGLMGLRLWSY